MNQRDVSAGGKAGRRQLKIVGLIILHLDQHAQGVAGGAIRGFNGDFVKIVFVAICRGFKIRCRAKAKGAIGTDREVRRIGTHKG